MIIFFIAITLLILGYIFYSPFVESQAGINPNAQTPQQKYEDGVDFIEVSPIKAFLIQFLNVAGVGPIFGPILGALYGPIALVWIVLGNILGGAVHDYFSGVMSIKEDGKSLPEIANNYFNIYAKIIMLVFTAMLLFFVGVVFVKSPAGLFSQLDIFQGTVFDNYQVWVIAILIYYFLATLLPIDKVITKLYPLFGVMMIIMTLSIAIMLFIKAPHLPIGSDFLAYFSHQKHDLLSTPNGLPIWPLLFTTITCSAISGFHSTQAPIMARCLNNEKYVRPVYYGAMMSEGLVGCVWAIAGMAAFPGGYEQLQSILAQGGPGLVVKEVASTYLGVLGGIVAIIAVAIFPITSGDTAFRALRLTIVDAFNIPQSTRNRLLLAIPILIIAYFITFLDFGLIWRYFSFSNMLLSTSVLWLATKYLFDRNAFHWITTLPATVGTAISLSYIISADIGFGLSRHTAITVAVIVAALCLIYMALITANTKNTNI